MTSKELQDKNRQHQHNHGKKIPDRPPTNNCRITSDISHSTCGTLRNGEKTISNYKSHPRTFSIQQYPSEHVIKGELNKINHYNLRKIISHGYKFSEPQYIDWEYNFEIMMDSFEKYTQTYCQNGLNLVDHKCYVEFTICLFCMNDLQNHYSRIRREIFFDTDMVYMQT